MPRLKQVGREAGNPYANQIFDMLFGDRDPIKEPGTATGTPGNWWTVFNNVPDIFAHTTDGFRLYRSEDRKLDPNKFKDQRFTQITKNFQQVKLVERGQGYADNLQGKYW